ncbi:hypothetical protein PG989_002092 [Apiospora arundinis]
MEPFCNGTGWRQKRFERKSEHEPVNGSVNAKVEMKARVARDWFGGDCDKPIADAILPGSNYGGEVHVYAPGHGMDYPPGWPYDRGPESVVGTSFAAPQAAGLVAYIRAHPGINAQTPSAVKAKVWSLPNRQDRDRGWG